MRPGGWSFGRRYALVVAGGTGLLMIAMAIAAVSGQSAVDLSQLGSDPMARTVLFRLRMPRIAMAGLTGASLAMVGVALQAMFRNPLAEPFTLGVSGGGALGASIAIAFGLSTSVVGVPLIFAASFAGALAAAGFVYSIARSGTLVLPGALLLAGVVVNLLAGAVVITLQYIAEASRALQMLRWTIGSFDVVGYDLIFWMIPPLLLGGLILIWNSRDLHLMAMGEESAAALGVTVQATELRIYLVSSLMVGVTVAVGGTIGFVGLIVPHAARFVLGQDIRLLLPASCLGGAAFLIAADTIARTLVPDAELPVGAVTAILGGPFFLWLLRRRLRYSAV